MQRGEIEKFEDDAELLTAYEQWLKLDQNIKTRNAIKEMADNNDLVQLRQHLSTRLQFGTAGLRGRMGPGTSCMNDLVIIQTSQGLARYVLECHENANAQPAVVIGYDGRHNSRRFAELTAVAFRLNYFKVYLVSNVCPTPFVPFAVKLFDCNVGVMVTASHNPKDDNGYKVYWGNGAQIISPHDKRIQAAIMKNLEPVNKAWDTDILKKDNADVIDPLPALDDVYYRRLGLNTASIGGHYNSSPLRFTYTSMHGVGYAYVKRALESVPVNVEELYVVAEQRDPDPDFPTVKFPNPEEGKSALTLAMKLADENKCPIILANDPDADRLAVAEKLPGGEWKIFNGNELGALLGWWCYHTHKECGKDQATQLNNSDLYMIASTVSSKFLNSMAEVEGFNFLETLTGFKWMGNKAHELRQTENKKVLFAFEEAIGFMVGDEVLDKDGVSAAAYLAQMATILYHDGISLNDQLQLLYDKYGYHVSHNSYYLCYDPETIVKVFDNIRNFHTNNGVVGYPSGLIDNKYNVIAVRDLTTGFDSEQNNQKAKLPVSKSSQMITFKFDNGLVLTLRTSGTEPKIKYYSELRSPPGKCERKGIETTLDEMIKAMIKEWLLPEKWGLTPRSED